MTLLCGQPPELVARRCWAIGAPRWIWAAWASFRRAQRDGRVRPGPLRQVVGIPIVVDR
jgi:hypothetical protein